MLEEVQSRSMEFVLFPVLPSAGLASSTVAPSLECRNVRTWEVSRFRNGAARRSAAIGIQCYIVIVKISLMMNVTCQFMFDSDLFDSEEWSHAKGMVMK